MVSYYLGGLLLTTTFVIFLGCLCQSGTHKNREKQNKLKEKEKKLKETEKELNRISIKEKMYWSHNDS